MNKCFFIGNTTADPELRYTKGEKAMAVANASIAVNEGYGDKQVTSFFDLVIWGQRAEAFAKYCPKGTRVAVEAKAKQEKWKDKNGNTRYKITFHVQDWEFAQKKAGESSESKESADLDGFMNVADVIEEDLPFS